jgi:hypothetical protein
VSKGTVSPGGFEEVDKLTARAVRRSALLLACVLGVVALLLLVPTREASASSGLVQLTLTSRWQATPGAGAWNPYVATVVNQGPATFTGDVSLQPANRYQPVMQYPTYRAHVSVPRGEQRSLTLYVVDGPLGYQAQLRDGGGHVVATARANPAGATSALAVLSDLPQAAGAIAAPLRAMTKQPPAVTRFDNPHDFPTNPVYLVGLAGVVIDQFDTAALAQTQIEALRSFVGLGGTLILAGGASWRRTLLPLPPALLPLKPEATAVASLGPLADLAGTTTAATAQVMTGQLRAGRPVLVSPDGTPLAVQSTYGAGKVVQLAYDPLAEPFEADLTLAAVAWSQAAVRAADPTTGNGSNSAAPTSALQADPTLTSAGSGFGAADTTPIYDLLNGTPSSGVPSAGLLAGLLVFYVLLAGVVNYMALRAVGRRGLMWVTTPLIAVVFTGGAYVVGFGSRGGAYLDNEVQLQRLAPDGSALTQSFHGVFSPRRGDFSVRMPADSLASTAIGGPGSQWADRSVIYLDGRPRVSLSDVPVWNMRPIQSLTVDRSHQASELEAHLKIRAGHLTGTIVNHTSQTLGPLKLFVGDREPVMVTPQLGPARSFGVDLPVASLPNQSRLYTDDRRDQTALLAAASAANVSDLTLVAVGQAPGATEIAGASPSHTSVAALVEPLHLESADSMPIPPRQRLVSSVTSGDGQVDVYDFQLPPGFSRPLALDLGAAGQSGVGTIEVYDWLGGTWRQLAVPGAGSAGQVPVRLSPGEGTLGPGLVRIRVHESASAQARVELEQQ